MPHILQDILIIFLASYATLDNQGITIMNYWPVTVGLFAGLIMGDLPTAMTIAGTFQLMSLGVAGLGGASVPDYGLATIVGILFVSTDRRRIGSRGCRWTASRAVDDSTGCFNKSSTTSLLTRH
ncbi:Phosphotransferase system,mannose/fructose/N-acetylgalactosamine-specific component IIC, partial [Lacticaseibacillus paracasei subsp. paracasei Lpp71]